ncbi:MAG: methyltransferase domain-containing protein [Planctomycetes bacterium]|nr:methyltransferase domain-containing protein [Planctomycetota bacterium]
MVWKGMKPLLMLVLMVGSAWLAAFGQQAEFDEHYGPWRDHFDEYLETEGGKQLEAPFVPTPPEVVAAMLRMAGVGKDDVVYDLGCGDGRIPVAAVKDFGAKRGVGVDLDPQRIKECHENAQKAGVADRLTFIEEDLYKADVRDCTVLGLYLYEKMNIKLRPILYRQLRPGARIVSHDFHMGDWEGDKVEKVKGPSRQHTVHFWVMPASVAGTWRWSIWSGFHRHTYTLTLRQRYQKISGTLTSDGQEAPIADAKLVGDQLSFTAALTAHGQTVKRAFAGRISGDSIKGTMDGTVAWKAARDKAKVVGMWRWTLPGSEQSVALRIERRDGQLAATYVDGKEERPAPDFYVWGGGIRFNLEPEGGKTIYEGLVQGDRISGTVDRAGAQPVKWEAAWARR